MMITNIFYLLIKTEKFQRWNNLKIFESEITVYLISQLKMVYLFLGFEPWKFPVYDTAFILTSQKKIKSVKFLASRPPYPFLGWYNLISILKTLSSNDIAECIYYIDYVIPEFFNLNLFNEVNISY
jgi:hypothetical protein